MTFSSLPDWPGRLYGFLCPPLRLLYNRCTASDALITFPSESMLDEVHQNTEKAKKGEWKRDRKRSEATLKSAARWICEPDGSTTTQRETQTDSQRCRTGGRTQKRCKGAKIYNLTKRRENRTELKLSTATEINTHFYICRRHLHRDVQRFWAGRLGALPLPPTKDMMRSPARSSFFPWFLAVLLLPNPS